MRLNWRTGVSHANGLHDALTWVGVDIKIAIFKTVFIFFRRRSLYKYPEEYSKWNKINGLFSLLTGLLTGAKQIISKNRVDLIGNLLTTWLLQIRMWSNPFQYATDGVLNILSKWLLMTKIKTIRSNNRHW